MRTRSAAIVIAASLAVFPPGATAQARSFDWTRPALQLDEQRMHPLITLGASALVPGAGQFLEGQERWVPYIVLEVWGWLTYFDRRADGRSAERRYKDLAWSVARRVSVGERRDTAFEYYEAMSKYETSGAFDADPQTEGLQPDIDPTTFNGNIWQLARSIFIPGGGSLPPGTPGYDQALAYYQRNAIPPSFAWAWGGSHLEQQVYNELIRESDDGYRAATLVLGAIVANHIVSAIDALVIARAPAGNARFRIGSGLEREGEAMRWIAKAQVVW